MGHTLFRSSKAGFRTTKRQMSTFHHYSFRYQQLNIKQLLKRCGCCSISSGTLFHIIWNVIPFHLECCSISSGTTFQVSENTPCAEKADYKGIISGLSKFTCDDTQRCLFDRNTGFFPDRRVYGHVLKNK